MGILNWFSHKSSNAYAHLMEESHFESIIATKRKTISQLETEICQLKNTLSIMKGTIELDELGLEFDPFSVSVNELEEKIKTLQAVMASLMGENKIIFYHRNYLIDGSTTKGKQFQQTYGKNILLGFNVYFDKKLKAVNERNVNTFIGLVNNNFAMWQKKAKILGIELNPQYLVYCGELLGLTAKLKYTQKVIKVQLANEKRMVAEQQKLEVEAEKERKRLLESRRTCEQNLLHTLTPEEKQSILDQLSSIDKRINDIDYQVKNKRAGWLYIASTPGMPNYVKIGVTRRLQPLVHLKELSSASVPFPFVCHGLVFDDDIFALETAIHSFYDRQRVNKSNRHKEFFEVQPQVVINELKKRGYKVISMNEECRNEEEGDLIE